MDEPCCPPWKEIERAESTGAYVRTVLEKRRRVTQTGDVDHSAQK